MYLSVSIVPISCINLRIQVDERKEVKLVVVFVRQVLIMGVVCSLLREKNKQRSFGSHHRIWGTNNFGYGQLLQELRF